VNGKPKITVAGAGMIGCYVGGALARAGRDVTLLVRPYLENAIRAHGLRISDLEGRDKVLSEKDIAVTSDPLRALASADIVLVTVKSGGTAEMAEPIAKHAPESCTIVSLQNGVNNVAVLRERAGAGRTVVPGMVPFNVVHEKKDKPHFHRSTSGLIVIGAGIPGLKAALEVPGITVEETADIESVQWAKLLMNLINAQNALGGESLLEGIRNRGWRKIFAAQIEEALSVYRAAGIKPGKVAGQPPRLIPWLLRLPDFLFDRIAPRMVSIDPRARTSMLEDLERGRPTEIDYLHGAIASLGRKHGIPTPTIDTMIRLVKKAEAAGKGSPRLKPEEISISAPS
jgi:2-dehydropantoate 2-reductase